MTKKHTKVDISAGRVKRDTHCGTFPAATMFPVSASWRKATMNDTERLSRLRHDLSNPLSALLAETQLLLLNESKIDPETLTSLREIEALAIRMRTMLREL